MRKEKVTYFSRRGITPNYRLTCRSLWIAINVKLIRMDTDIINMVLPSLEKLLTNIILYSWHRNGTLSCEHKP